MRKVRTVNVDQKGSSGSQTQRPALTQVLGRGERVLFFFSFSTRGQPSAGLLGGGILLYDYELVVGLAAVYPEPSRRNEDKHHPSYRFIEAQAAARVGLTGNYSGIRNEGWAMQTELLGKNFACCHNPALRMLSCPVYLAAI
jgi:hypothetical protein